MYEWPMLWALTHHHTRNICWLWAHRYLNDETIWSVLFFPSLEDMTSMIPKIMTPVRSACVCVCRVSNGSLSPPCGRLDLLQTGWLLPFVLEKVLWLSVVTLITNDRVQTRGCWREVVSQWAAEPKPPPRELTRTTTVSPTRALTPGMDEDTVGTGRVRSILCS